jgi:hypothetical protein
MRGPASFNLDAVKRQIVSVARRGPAHLLAIWADAWLTRMSPRPRDSFAPAVLFECAGVEDH